MKLKDYYLELDNDTLIAQRSARNLAKRDARIMFIIMAVGFVLLLVAIPFLSKHLPLYLTLSLILIFYIFIKLASNWRGWVALRSFNLHCPHCKQPLFTERINILRSPSKKCPNCGQIALASIKQLNQK
jgi:hypothetical protein